MVGVYQPGEGGNLHERFASALGLAVEAVEEGGFGGVGEEKGICPGLDASFFGIFIGEVAFGHDAFEDAVGPPPLFTYCSRWGVGMLKERHAHRMQRGRVLDM